MPTHEATLLSMPKRLSPALESLQRIFSRSLPEVTIVMGGGSVLAARWHHRDSTDIDLFVPPTTMISLTTERFLDYQGALTSLQEFGNVNLDPANGFLSGEIMQTPFSLAASEFVDERPPRSERVGTTDFQAATNQEILSGKIKGRLHRRGIRPVRAPIRDLYDIVVAARLDTGVIDRVLASITPKGKSVIADDLRRLPDNLHEIDPKPLLNPKYRVALEGLPTAIAAAIEAGKEALLPKTTRISWNANLHRKP